MSNHKKTIETVKRKNVLVPFLFLTISILLVSAWGYFDLPKKTATDFVIRGLTTTLLATFFTVLIVKVLSSNKNK